MEIKKTSWPNVYSCNFIEQGLVSYDDVGEGILYVPKEALDRMLPTIIGKPVVIKHRKVTPDNYEQFREQRVIVGNVIRAWFNPQDGWFWCDFLVDTQVGRERIDIHKDTVSCAYAVIDAKEGGLWHDIKYDGELVDGSFTHLALVESPRYEGAKITKQLPMMLVNEKAAHLITNEEDTEMNIKELINSIFNKKADGSKEVINPVVILNGKEFPLSTVLEAIQEKFNGEGEMKGVMAKDDMLVDINGHSYSVADIKKNFKPENEKKNCNCSAKDGESHKEDCAMYNKKNEKTEEEKAKEEKDKENAKKVADAAAETKRLQDVENARKIKEKEGQEFFNALESLANSNPNEEPAMAPAPLTRQERANKKRDQVNKQFTK